MLLSEKHWKPWGRQGGVQLNMGIDKRLCVTVPEAAERLDILGNLMYTLIKQGEPRVIGFGKGLVTSRAALEKMLKKGM